MILIENNTNQKIWPLFSCHLVWRTNQMGDQPAAAGGRAIDQRETRQFLWPWAMGSTSCAGLQHGPAVDGRGTISTVTSLTQDTFRGIQKNKSSSFHSWVQVWSWDVPAVSGVCLQEVDGSRSPVPGAARKTQPAHLPVRRAPAEASEPWPQAGHDLRCGVTTTFPQLLETETSSVRTIKIPELPRVIEPNQSQSLVPCARHGPRATVSCWPVTFSSSSSPVSVTTSLQTYVAPTCTTDTLLSSRPKWAVPRSWFHRGREVIWWGRSQGSSWPRLLLSVAPYWWVRGTAL